MLQEDPRRTHLDADPSRIAAIYESTNQPLVQPVGRSAQSAQAAVVAMQDGPLYDVVVALTLGETGENVVYASPPVREKDLPQSIEEALNFAESMGFILDASGWANLDEDHRAEMLERMPAFRAPGPRLQAVAERPKAADPLSAVARLFAAFAFLCLVSCSGMSAEQRTQAAEIHQQLGDNLLTQGDAQQALKEYTESIQYEETAEARNGMGLIYAFSLGRLDEGEKEFRRALEMKPDFPEALNNLGAVYLARKRFADAVPPLEKAARDPLYTSRILAQSNLGWALYKLGQTEKGVAEIRGALAVAPRYCRGWQQLGIIYSEQGRLDDASSAFGRYIEVCPDVPDAYLQAGKVLVRQSKAVQARAAFEHCAVARNEKDKPVAAECAKYLRELGAP